jgi:hypothetical protein
MFAKRKRKLGRKKEGEGIGGIVIRLYVTPLAPLDLDKYGGQNTSAHGKQVFGKINKRKQFSVGNAQRVRPNPGLVPRESRPSALVPSPWGPEVASSHSFPSRVSVVSGVGR